MNVRVMKQTTASKSALIYLDLLFVIAATDTRLMLTNKPVEVRHFICKNNTKS